VLKTAGRVVPILALLVGLRAARVLRRAEPSSGAVAVAVGPVRVETVTQR
jgi:hypothetical protein